MESSSIPQSGSARSTPFFLQKGHNSLTEPRYVDRTATLPTRLYRILAHLRHVVEHLEAEPKPMDCGFPVRVLHGDFGVDAIAPLELRHDHANVRCDDARVLGRPVLALEGCFGWLQWRGLDAGIFAVLGQHRVARALEGDLG